MEAAKQAFERRKYIRLKKRIPVDFTFLDSFQQNSRNRQVVTHNISASGMLLESGLLKDMPFDAIQKASLFIEFNLPNNLDSFKLKSQVMWLENSAETYKIGIKFDQITDEERDGIGLYIENELDSVVKSAPPTYKNEDEVKTEPQFAELTEQKKNTEITREIVHTSFPIQKELSVVVKRPKEEVYRLLKNLEQFPTFMNNVKYISIVNGRRNSVISEWEIEIDGATFTWKEEDLFDDKNMVIRFRMIEGEFSRYEGQWSLFELLAGTEVRLSIIIDWGMPRWERHARYILENKTKIYLQEMLAAIKHRMWSVNDTKLEKFACIIHTVDLGYVASNFDPSASEKKESFLKKILEWTPPFQCSYITGIQSVTGKKIDGELILCPLLAEQILSLNKNFVLERVIEAGKLAERKGAKIVGLAAYTAGVGRKGILVANALNIPVTTGTSYTIAVVIESILKAAEKIGIELSDANVMIVGATGSIGSICSRILANNVRQLVLIARNKERLNNLASSIRSSSIANIKIDNMIDKCMLQNTDIIMTVTSTPQDLIDVKSLKPGALICDISIPKNILKEAANSRKDILVIDGGIVKVPGNVNFNFDIGLAPSLTYACIAETMILALEEKYECYSIGGNISLDKVKEISQSALKHGFKLAELRSFGKEVREEELELVRRKI